jgi:hypothetical protein
MLGEKMNYHLRNLFWSLSEPFGVKRKANIVAEVINAAGSHLMPSDYGTLECSFRVHRRMLDSRRLETMFIVRAQVLEKLEDLMVEIYRDYQRSRTEKTLLFYRDSSLTPVSVIGRGKGYDFIHVVRNVEQFV